MKILIESKDGNFKQVANLTKESDTGFYCYFNDAPDIPFKFPWDLYTYTKLEER
tara:strand:+ start:99 stop:260 length:162 start_codon:yes stop_codon:yes gene_type:complete